MSKLDEAYKSAMRAATKEKPSRSGRSKLITEERIRYVTRRLSRPATEAEIAFLVEELAGRYYSGYDYQLDSLIVTALNDLRRR